MDFFEVVEKRYSVRDFEPEREVSDEDVDKILRAAIRAPSAGNMQPWFFFVVRSRAKKQALAEAAFEQDFVAQASVVIVVCADPARSAQRYGSRGASLYCLQDTAAATEHILLAATAAGLGTCWVGAFSEDEATRALDLPSHLRPVAIIPIGYPSDQGRGPERRSLDEVTSSI